MWGSLIIYCLLHKNLMLPKKKRKHVYNLIFVVLFHVCDLFNYLFFFFFNYLLIRWILFKFLNMYNTSNLNFPRCLSGCNFKKDGLWGQVNFQHSKPNMYYHKNSSANFFCLLYVYSYVYNSRTIGYFSLHKKG